MQSLSESYVIGPVSQSAGGFAQRMMVVVVPAAAPAAKVISVAVAVVPSSSDLHFSHALMQLIDATARAHRAAAGTVGATLLDTANALVAESLDLGRKSMETQSMARLFSLQADFIERRFLAAFGVVSAMRDAMHSQSLAAWKPFDELGSTSGRCARGEIAPTQAVKAA